MNWKLSSGGWVFHDDKGKICGRVYEGFGNTNAYISFGRTAKEKCIGSYISTAHARQAVEDIWEEYQAVQVKLEACEKWDDMSVVLKELAWYTNYD